MKNSFKSISPLLAASVAGVAFLPFVNSAFVAALPVDILTAVVISAAVIGLAVSDYSRGFQPLTVRRPALRPALPRTPARAVAYDASSSHDDRIAA